MHVEADVAVLAVHGRLDADSGRQLVDATATLASGDPGGSTPVRPVTRIDVDLQHIDSFSPEGAAALVACRDVADRLSGGLRYLTGRGAGCDALLAAYAEES